MSLELARVTERAAIAAARLRGQGREKEADQAAVDAMRRELNGKPFVVGGWVDLGAWRFVLLDSCVAGSAGGRLSDAALAELDRALGTAANKHVMVCLHHHPVPMHSRWLDNVGLSNANEFWSVIDSHPQVKAVVWGHVHQNFEGIRRGVRLLATPSTCAQFQPRSDQFVIDNQPPAYRLLTLHSNGAIDTGVHFLTAAESAA
jgi:Icc protein